MSRVLISVGLLVAISYVPASAQDEFKGPELFPLANFNTWTYRVDGQDDRLHVTSFQVLEKIGDFRCYRFEGRMRNQTIASEHISVRKDGVYRVRHDNVDLEPPLLICRFPPRKGDKWTGEYKINGQKSMIAYECDLDEIAVLKNPKVQVLVVRGTINDGNGTLKSTCWYAPKLGLVRQVIEEGDARIVIELESFGLPKKGGPKPLSP